LQASSPATIKTLTKTTNPAVAGVLACNNKDLDENNNLSHFILAGRLQGHKNP